MKPNRIILVRHGESEGNVDKAVYATRPDYTLELTDKGRQQATEAGNQINALIGSESVFAYVSPMWRTRTTFKQIAAVRNGPLQWREEPRLREQDWGHLRPPDEGQTIDRQRDAFGTFYYRIMDGESAADVYDRVSDFFNTLHRDFEKLDYPNNVLVVTHGVTIRLFLMRWFHWEVEEFEQISNPHNGELFVLERQKNGKYILNTSLRQRPAAHTYQRPLQFKITPSSTYLPDIDSNTQAIVLNTVNRSAE